MDFLSKVVRCIQLGVVACPVEARGLFRHSRHLAHVCCGRVEMDRLASRTDLLECLHRAFTQTCEVV